MSGRVRRIGAGIACFLLGGREGWVLVDTGPAMARGRLIDGLRKTGWSEQDRLTVVVTHGDTDHIGSCAYLQRAFSAAIAVHPLEAQTAESGDMNANRKKRPDRLPWYFRALMPLGRLFGAAESFAPDVLLEDGDRLSAYGIDAAVLHLPGHSKGSIGVLTDSGDLFCGDLFWNVRRPRLHPLLDDLEAARNSVERLRDLPIETVHPAHGRSFAGSKLSELIPSQ